MHGAFLAFCRYVRVSIINYDRHTSRLIFFSAQPLRLSETVSREDRAIFLGKSISTWWFDDPSMRVLVIVYQSLQPVCGNISYDKAWMRPRKYSRQKRAKWQFVANSRTVEHRTVIRLQTLASKFCGPTCTFGAHEALRKQEFMSAFFVCDFRDGLVNF